MAEAKLTIEFIPEPEWKSFRANMKQSREHTLGAMHSILRRIGKLLTPAIKEETPVGATGHLKNYTVFQVLGQAMDMRLEIRQSAKSPKGYPYGMAVRSGTRPHFPPYEALIPWVTKKLSIGDPKEARSVAFLVARKISRVGTPANPYHTRVYGKMKYQVNSIMREEISKLTNRLAKK